MKTEKAIVRVELLHSKVAKYKILAIKGINAKSDEVKSIWVEFTDLRNFLTELNYDLFHDLRLILMPEPIHLIGGHAEGNLIYLSKHFNEIESEIEKALRYVNILRVKPSKDTIGVVEENDSKGFNINASHGSSVSINIGDNNTVSQNSSKITQIYKELSKLGLDNDDIKKLQKIVKENTDNENKERLSSKIFHWISDISSKVLEKKITENLPNIINKAKSLIEIIN